MISNELKIQYFSNLILWRDDVGEWPKSQNCREIARTTVNLGKQDGRDRGQAGRVDDKRRGLPLFWRQWDRSTHNNGVDSRKVNVGSVPGIASQATQ